MALVDYTSSDGEEEDERKEDPAPTVDTRKRKREENDLPPLPSKFHDLYASRTRLSTRDDPSLHGGRKRITPHVEGNWPTHLYLEWYPSMMEYNSLTALISSLKTPSPPKDPSLKITSFLTSDLGAPLPLHISLSRPIGFSTEDKEPFVASLNRAIKSSSVRPFNVSFADLDWVPNFENTRWFLVLRIQKPESDGLNKLLHICNAVVQEYGQPPLYSKATGNDSKSAQRATPGMQKLVSPSAPSMLKNTEDLSAAFHISIAWALTAPSPQLIALTKSVRDGHLTEINQMSVVVSEVKAKVGNIVTNMPLSKSVALGGSLFGL